MPAAAPSPMPGSVAASVGMPMTCPSRSTRAPPLLPGLIAADVCTMLAMVAPVPPSVLPSLTVRPVADTMPWVTLDDSPSGEPIASTIWPTSTFEESPNPAAFSPSGIPVQLDDREILLRVRVDELRGQLVLAVGRRHLEGLLVPDHMRVRDDVPLVVVHDPGAEIAGRPDLHDRRQDVLDHLLVVVLQIVRGPGSGGPGGLGATFAPGRRPTAGTPTEQDHAAAADDQGKNPGRATATEPGTRCIIHVPSLASRRWVRPVVRGRTGRFVSPVRRTGEEGPPPGGTDPCARPAPRRPAASPRRPGRPRRPPRCP